MRTRSSKQRFRDDGKDGTPRPFKLQSPPPHVSLPGQPGGDGFREEDYADMPRMSARSARRSRRNARSGAGGTPGGSSLSSANARNAAAFAPPATPEIGRTPGGGDFSPLDETRGGDLPASFFEAHRPFRLQPGVRVVVITENAHSVEAFDQADGAAVGVLILTGTVIEGPTRSTSTTKNTRLNVFFTIIHM